MASSAEPPPQNSEEDLSLGTMVARLYRRAADLGTANYRDGATFALIRPMADREAQLLAQLREITTEKACLILELKEAYQLVGKLIVAADKERPAVPDVPPPAAPDVPPPAGAAGPDPVKCQACRRYRAGCTCAHRARTPEPKRLRDFERSAPVLQGREFVCARCGYRFECYQNYERHLLEHHHRA